MSTKPIQMKSIVAMQYDLVEGKAGSPSVSGNARGALIVNDLAFTRPGNAHGHQHRGRLRKRGRRGVHSLERGQMVHGFMDGQFQHSGRS